MVLSRSSIIQKPTSGIIVLLSEIQGGGGGTGEGPGRSPDEKLFDPPTPYFFMHEQVGPLVARHAIG